MNSRRWAEDSSSKETRPMYPIHRVPLPPPRALQTTVRPEKKIACAHALPAGAARSLTVAGIGGFVHAGTWLLFLWFHYFSANSLSTSKISCNVLSVPQNFKTSYQSSFLSFVSSSSSSSISELNGVK
jgi:hypothetical protein